MKLLQYISIIWLISACNPARYIYMNDNEATLHDTVTFKTIKPEYYLQPGDVLYVSIHSTLSETEGMFHFPGQGNSGSMGGAQGGSMYLNQSVIDDNGNIRMPVLGEIYVAGSTVEEVEKIVEIEARKYVEDALARVKLVSYEITFMGEFGHIGKLSFYKDRIHVLDAISQAGEVSYYGNRKNVRLLRQTPDGFISYRIDLTDKDLIASDKFYLQPNDILYAEPLPRQIFREKISDYTFIMATISSAIGFIAIILSLNK